jgi:DNA-binding response OmpR family regulator
MLKVLFVADDKTVAAMVGEILLEEGFISTHAADVETGWASMLSEDPDALMVDVWLHAHAAGWDLLDRVRQIDHFKSLPVVVLSQFPGKDMVERARSYGAEFLAKPFTPQALLDRLRRAIREAGYTPRLRAHRVILLTPAYRIEGELHLTEELERFSDAWEALIRDARAYLPVTNATVIKLEGSITLPEAAFIEVRKADVVAVFPNHETDD